MRTTSRAHAALRKSIAATTVMLLLVPETRAVEIQVCTERGPFRIELFDEQAPLHTANFLEYVERGFYTGTAFHRVVGGAIVQGGGFDRMLRRRITAEAVPNESDNGLSNERGTIAAARSERVDSATSQFYVNLRDNPDLDGSSRDPGYTVFGRIVEGLEVLDEIGSLPTGPDGPLPSDVPIPLVVVDSMTVIGPSAAAGADGGPPTVPLRERLMQARRDGDFVMTLATIDHLRMGCAPIGPDLLVIEAEAALALDEVSRAGYVLNEYFAITDASDPSLPMAQALYRRLPPVDQTGIDPLIAHCSLPARPVIPDGRAADRATMIEAQTAIRHFIDSSDAYLDCVSEVIDEESLTDIQEVAAVGRHNETVELMENLAEEFNRQVRAFRARED